MYYYSANEQRYFKNEEDIFRFIIYIHDFHKNGIYKYGIKEEEPLDIMGHKYNRKIFYVTGKRWRFRDEIIRSQITVREVESIPEGIKPFSAEEYMHGYTCHIDLTEKERKVWERELNHFRKYPTVEDLKNNLYKRENKND